jgi:ADP-ribosyltransferase exoenzyme
MIAYTLRHADGTEAVLHEGGEWDSALDALAVTLNDLFPPDWSPARGGDPLWAQAAAAATALGFTVVEDPPDQDALEDEIALDPVAKGDPCPVCKDWCIGAGGVNRCTGPKGPRPAKEGWHKTLTQDERGALKFYTTDMGARNVNHYLRGKGSFASWERRSLDATIGHMDRAIAKAGTFDTPVEVWRGLSGARHGATAMFKEGRTVQVKNYSSTSFSKRQATEFVGSPTEGGGALLRIIAKRGAYLHDKSVTDKPKEQELVLPRNSKFKVRAKTTEDFEYPWGARAKIAVITLEQL